MTGNSWTFFSVWPWSHCCTCRFMCLCLLRLAAPGSAVTSEPFLQETDCLKLLSLSQWTAAKCWLALSRRLIYCLPCEITVSHRETVKIGCIKCCRCQTLTWACKHGFIYYFFLFSKMSLQHLLRNKVLSKGPLCLWQTGIVCACEKFLCVKFVGFLFLVFFFFMKSPCCVT